MNKNKYTDDPFEQYDHLFEATEEKYYKKEKPKKPVLLNTDKRDPIEIPAKLIFIAVVTFFIIFLGIVNFQQVNIVFAIAFIWVLSAIFKSFKK